MSSIIWNGDTFHGISVESRGVFTHQWFGTRTYAGQIRDGHACGLGVLTWPDGTKDYAEYGPDGKYDGRRLVRHADGDPFFEDRWAGGDTDYNLFERGERKEYARVSANGRCTYYGEVCAADDPRLLALIAQVAPVEVRPAAPAPHPLLGPPLAPKQSSEESADSFCPRRRWRRPWPRRCIPMPHTVAGGRATQPNHQTHCNARPRSDACTDRFAEVVTMEATACTLNNRRLVHQWARPGSFVAMPRSSTPPYRTLPLGAGFAVLPLRSV
jgi:hypothetical protein